MEITDKNYKELIESGNPILLDFSALWCGPCKRLTPIINDLELEYKDKIVIGKVDVDENNDISVEYGIRNIPALLFFKDGKVVDKIIGSTTKDKIIEKLESLLN